MDWNDIKFQQLLNLAQQQNPQFAQGPQKIIRDEADTSNPLNAYQVNLSSLGMPGKAEVAYTPSGQPIFALRNDPSGSGHSVRLAGNSAGGVDPTYFNVSNTSLDHLMDWGVPVALTLGAGAAMGAVAGAAGAADAGTAAGGTLGSSIPADISGEIAGGANTLSAGDIAAAGGGTSFGGGGGALGTIGSGLSTSIPADLSGELASTGSGLSTVTPEEIASAGGGYSGNSGLGALTVDENQGANELAKLTQQNAAQPGSLLNTNVPTYDTTGGNSLVDKLINKGENTLINKGIQALTGSGGSSQGAGGALGSLGGGMGTYAALPTMQIGQHAQWQPEQAFMPSVPNMPEFQQVQGYADGGIVDDVASWFGGDNYSAPDVSSSVGDILNSDQGQNEWSKLVQQNDTNQALPVESGTNGSDLWDTLKGGLGSAWDTVKNMDPKTMQMILGGIGLANSILGKHGVNAQGIPTSLQGQLGMLGALNRSPSAANMAAMAHYFNSPAYTKTQQFIGTPVQYSQIPYTNQGTFQWFTHKDGGMADSGHPHTAGHPMGMLNMMADGGHVNGPGNGQSDHVHALLSRDEFVIPADVVSSLGGGSSKAGGESLQELIEAVRKDTRSAPLNKIPPAPKHPMTYLKEQK